MYEQRPPCGDSKPARHGVCHARHVDGPCVAGRASRVRLRERRPEPSAPSPTASLAGRSRPRCLMPSRTSRQLCADSRALSSITRKHFSPRASTAVTTSTHRRPVVAQGAADAVGPQVDPLVAEPRSALRPVLLVSDALELAHRVGRLHARRLVADQGRHRLVRPARRHPVQVEPRVAASTLALRRTYGGTSAERNGSAGPDGCGRIAKRRNELKNMNESGQACRQSSCYLPVTIQLPLSVVLPSSSQEVL